ncbi:MAG: ABC transporter substrate-binding protein [Nitrospiraceae bacterium]
MRLYTAILTIAILVGASLGAYTDVSAETTSGPGAAIAQTVAEIQQALHQTPVSDSDVVTQREALDRILRSRVSHEDMAKRALGAQWGMLTDPQRQEFTGLFLTLLRDTFAHHVAQLTDNRIDVLAEQQNDATHAEVQTRLSGSKVDTPVDFRLLHRNEEWLVYDVVVDGASLVQNYRAQMARVIKAGSYTSLVEQLKARAVSVTHVGSAH